MRENPSPLKLPLQVFLLGLILGLLLGCSAPSPPTAVPTRTPTITRPVEGLSDDQTATLSSLEKIDDYPLYTMHYYGAYHQWVAAAGGSGWSSSADLTFPEADSPPPAWACSLFAALGDEDNMLYGRNFDWQYSPAILLFTDPPEGFASVSMVDIAYLGFGGSRAGALTDLPLIERKALLNAPFLPFDGMNERGLAVGMAAVPPGDMLPDPDKETIGSLGVMRKILDRAGTVAQAVDILGSYNIDMGGGPPIHYLIADKSGRSALVEFYQGEMVVTPNETPWHLATNFLRAAVSDSPGGQCWRYDRISQNLSDGEGQLSAMEAVELLEEVSQENTQWSVVYGMDSGEVKVIMGRQYGSVHTLTLGR